MRHFRPVILILAAAAIAAALWWYDLAHFLSLEYLQSQLHQLVTFRDRQPVVASILFVIGYVVAAALSIPGAAVLTVAGGAVFGLLWGTLLVSVASTIGATAALLVARYALRNVVRRRFGGRLAAVDAGIAKDGAFYLFGLRLVPVVPFFLVNLLTGLTAMPVRTFFWVSQLGMLPATIVYVNAGSEAAHLASLHGLMSLRLLGAFGLLALLPFVARHSLEAYRDRRIYARFHRPRRFDRNLIVIGAGAGGLVTSYIAAAVRARVTLIEKSKMGGDCLNYGCVPSKAIIRSAKFASHLKRAGEFGFDDVTGASNFRKVMERVASVVKDVEPHDSVARYAALGVEVLQGSATLVDPWTVAVHLPGGEIQRLTAPTIVIAAGAEPSVPDLPGLAEAGYLTSDTLWEIRELPKRLVVLGGGPIGCELAQAFSRLGASVTQVQSRDRLLPREDPEVSEIVMRRFRAEGIDLRLGARATGVRVVAGERRLVVEERGIESEIPFDQILIAVGRRARLAGYGLEALGVDTDRTIQVNEHLQTNYPNIYAVGDVAGPFQFTHTAAHMGWYAAVNALFSPLLWLRGGRFKVDYSVIPWATFTEPEVAHVGMNESDAIARNVPYEVVRYDLAELDRAIADGEPQGFVKVLTVPGKDRILGATIVGEHAADLLAEFVLAMRHGLGLKKLLSTIHIYPTLAEANKYAAGAWRLAHQPKRLLRYVESFHAWRRG